MVKRQHVVITLAVVALVLCIQGMALGDEVLKDWLTEVRSFGKLRDPISQDQLPGSGSVCVLFALFGTFALLIALFSRSVHRLVGHVVQAFRYAIGILRACLIDMKQWERVFFYSALVVCAALRTVCAIRDPVMIDEALTWYYFTSKGPIACLVFYPEPNNHILHSLMTTVSTALPIDTLIALRLPVILVAVLAQAFLHLFIRNVAGAVAGAMTMALVLSAPPFLYFGVYSRGYMLVLLAFIVAFAATVLVLRTGDRRALRIVAIASVVGLFTIPSFLYPVAVIFAFLLWRSPQGHLPRRTVLRAMATVAVVTLVLYLPAIMLNGIAAFTANPWVLPTGLDDVMRRWSTHFEGSFAGLVGFPNAMTTVLVLALIGLVIAHDRDRPVALCASFVIVMSLAIPFAHRVLPFERTWIYLLVPIAVLFGLVLHTITTHWLRVAFVVPIALALFVVRYHNYRRDLPQHEYAAYHARTLSVAVRSEDRKDILCAMPVSGVHLVFDLDRRGETFTYSLMRADDDPERMPMKDRYSLVLANWSTPLSRPDVEEIYEDGFQRLYKITGPSEGVDSVELPEEAGAVVKP